MAKKIAVMIADGCEEIEALTPVTGRCCANSEPLGNHQVRPPCHNQGDYRLKLYHRST